MDQDVDYPGSRVGGQLVGSLGLSFEEHFSPGSAGFEGSAEIEGDLPYGLIEREEQRILILIPWLTGAGGHLERLSLFVALIGPVPLDLLLDALWPGFGPSFVPTTGGGLVAVEDETLTDILGNQIPVVAPSLDGGSVKIVLPRTRSQQSGCGF